MNWLLLGFSLLRGFSTFPIFSSLHSFSLLRGLSTSEVFNLHGLSRLLHVYIASMSSIIHFNFTFRRILTCSHLLNNAGMLSTKWINVSYTFSSTWKMIAPLLKRVLSTSPHTNIHHEALLYVS
jgi:hypothetical protein